MLFAHIVNHARDIEIVTDAVLFATRGVIHPRILSPTILRNSATKVRDTLYGISFPLENSDATIQLFKIADIQIIFSKFHLIYRISVPLIDKQKYTIHKIIPLPVQQSFGNFSNTFAYIWPKHQYFAVTASNTYFPMDIDMINKCKKLNNLRICKDIEPIREIDDNAPCELKAIITGSIDITAPCDIRITPLQQTFWVRLHATNSWAFSSPRNEQLFVQCQRGDHHSFRLVGTGILKLGPECSAHTSDTRLISARVLKPCNHALK